jgi:hypothetical protein
VAVSPAYRYGSEKVNGCCEAAAAAEPAMILTGSFVDLLILFPADLKSGHSIKFGLKIARYPGYAHAINFIAPNTDSLKKTHIDPWALLVNNILQLVYILFLFGKIWLRLLLNLLRLLRRLLMSVASSLQL